MRKLNKQEFPPILHQSSHFGRVLKHSAWHKQSIQQSQFSNGYFTKFKTFFDFVNLHSKDIDITSFIYHIFHISASNTIQIRVATNQLLIIFFVYSPLKSQRTDPWKALLYILLTLHFIWGWARGNSRNSSQLRSMNCARLHFTSSWYPSRRLDIWPPR